MLAAGQERMVKFVTLGYLILWGISAFWTAVCGVLCEPLRSTAWMQAGGSLGASAWLELGV